MDHPGVTVWPAAPLRDRVVLVTGGAQGIGRGIAEAILGAGGKVLIGDLDVEAGEACQQTWNDPAMARFQRLDIRDESSVEGFVAAGLQYFGQVDGLVNNAGVAQAHQVPVTALDWSQWNQGLASLHGAFLCCKHALPLLARGSRQASIVNIASTRAWQSEAHSEAYAAAKGGLVALSHALAVSEGPAVRVNSISPGWIATEAWQAPSRRQPPELSAADHAQHPVGRVGYPPDIAQLAVYLLSSMSGFVTGQDFVVDGGMSKVMHYL
ncbi:SDR family oxidoreductase [Frateuria aurantia]